MHLSLLNKVTSSTLLMLIAVSSVFVISFAFKNAMGNLYFVSLEQLVAKHQDNITQDAVNALQDQVSGVEKWSIDNPQYLLYLAQTERWMGNYDGYHVNQNLIEQRLHRANAIRPTSAHQFAQLARESWLEGDGNGAVRSNLSKAQQLAPFDTRIALYSLDYYLSYWPELSLDEKIQATRYLLNSQNYQITYEWKYLFRDQEKKTRACSLLNFNNVNNRYCK
ncbi:hypothetical protein VISI1226_10722 [Vibrio sinaloensis DSM 21326]|uniref:Uncharacterized protein n=1 Tax=Vibrio sinaloensis DSM 21326 TaxID=945550 RepID=E8MAW6_PHOS4|nr:hypothetical protein [Vibrio sinaloensis]EGA68796.1 hypothetical protein VISI1226_10722 [Vibrio sinaloensis DSM 21326]